MIIVALILGKWAGFSASAARAARDERGGEVLAYFKG